MRLFTLILAAGPLISFTIVIILDITKKEQP